MNRHPGGEAQTLHLLENIEWKKEMKALDLGAGEGDTVRILKSFGLDAHGVDLFPRSSDVETGNFLHLQYPSDSIDLCISQCAFFVSRDQKNAQSGMIRSAAKSISFCRKNIKERSCAIPCWLAERSSTWIFMKES